MSNAPFIKLFSSPRGYYFFDVNRDSIVPISSAEFCYLQGKEKNISPSEKAHMDSLKAEGYLSCNKIKEIKHPDTDSIAYWLNKKCTQLILQVTQSCNLVCYYCPYANKTEDTLQRNHTNKKMSWETAKKSIDFFSSHSSESDEVTIGFYGGEPLLSFQLMKKCIEYADEAFIGKNINYNMTTNGTLLTDEMIDFLCDNGVQVTFSIDGPQKVHDINRRKADGSGSFGLAFLNLKKMLNKYKDNARGKIAINMVLNPENDVDDIFSLFEDSIFDYGIINVQASLADDDFLEKNITINENYKKKMTYHYFLGFLKYLKIVEFKKSIPFLDAYFSMLEKKYNAFKKKAISLPEIGAPGGPCIPGQRRLFVDVDGVLYPCERVSEVSEVMKIGNLNDGFEFQKVDNILNIGRLTSDSCKNCYASVHCQLCARCADDGDKLSPSKKLKHCIETYNSLNSDIKSCILIREAKTLYKR